ncbi:MAG: DJ-1 family glyoxalase III [Helicobacter sp.]|nr:DJ-1/PfpI family protein [Helicobacteraceae bacterium]MDY3112875.1 DJ-1 family glyoxalase III [Helicobacter sp.]
MILSVLVTLANGFEELEAISVIDVLRRAKCEVLVAKVGNDDLVATSQTGVKIKCDIHLNSVDSSILEGIVFPGGWGGTMELANETKLTEILELLNKNNKIIAAICAAPFALFKHGILTNQNFTCYPSVEEKIDNPNYKTQSVVQDGNIITSKGPGSALEFALYLAEIFTSKEVAREVKEGMLIA